MSQKQANTPAGQDAQAQSCMPAELSKELVRLAGIMRDCGRLVSTTGRAEEIILTAATVLAASPQPAPQPEQEQPIMDRADDLHNKAGMPWEQAEKLALEERGIGDPEIDEMIGNCSTSAVVSLLHEEEVREFVRSIAVQQYRIDARTALRDAMNKSNDIAGYMRNPAPLLEQIAVLQQRNAQLEQQLSKFL